MFSWSKPATMTAEAEAKFHESAQRNALGGYIGCDGPQCWAQIQELTNDGIGHKIRDVP